MLDKHYEQAAKYFADSSEIFMKLNCTEMKLDADLNTAKALLHSNNYQACKVILSEASSENTSSSHKITLLHLKGVLLFQSSNGDEKMLKKSILLLEKSILNADELTSDEIVFMYGNLYKALQSAGSNTEKSIAILEEGHKLLESQFSSITSESIKNSILSRTDIMSYLYLCKHAGLNETLLENVVSVIPESNDLNFPGGNV